MAKKITAEKLTQLLSDISTKPEDVATYFKLDEVQSAAFSPIFGLDPETVDVSSNDDDRERSAQLLNLANGWARRRRQYAFYRKSRGGYTGPIIVSEGDSWNEYPIILHDVVDHVMDDYAVKSLGAAGDTLSNMVRESEYLSALEETGASIFLISGGGNDLVADGGLADHLEDYDPAYDPADYLKPSYQRLLEKTAGQFEQIFSQVKNNHPSVHVICHGYDYSIPNNGKWLGKPMKQRGISKKLLQKNIAAEMVDRFNGEMRRLAGRMPHVSYIDCRGSVNASEWHDELHPKSSGFKKVAALFKDEIEKVSKTRSAPSKLYSGPFQSTGDTKQNERSEEVSSRGSTRKAVSLHIGINEVDPAHYAGWSGPLVACENDAVAMEKIAQSQGFRTEKLLSREATRDKVINTIHNAAKVLNEGDMFFMSVSSHGASLEDYNKDEIHDDPANMMDEALCLYDGMLLDDELYYLWQQFRPGVRILMMPDTCHSGTMIRSSPPPSSFKNSSSIPRYRRADQKKIDKTVLQNSEFYRKIANRVPLIPENIMFELNSGAIKSSVISISGCQDTQKAKDGDQYGAFTGAVLEVWDDGNFDGDYLDFHQAIVHEMNDPTQEAMFFSVGTIDDEFSGAKPFCIRSIADATISSSKLASPKQTPIGSDCDFLSALISSEGKEPDEQSKLSMRSRSGTHPWSEYSEFSAYIESLHLRYFSADELLSLGGSHASGACKNSYPPKSKWTNIADTARVLDELRSRLGKSISISSAYRSEGYNNCIGGAVGSQHKKYKAIDFSSSGESPANLAGALFYLRDVENFFVGGIGLYNTFVHIDTRGTNADWNNSAQGYGSAPDWVKNAVNPFRQMAHVRTAQNAKKCNRDRISRLRAMEIDDSIQSNPRSSVSTSTMSDSETIDMWRSRSSEYGVRAQAAVDSSSIVSLANSLTPQQNEDTLLSMLFAERAASSAFDRVEDARNWYAKYAEVLNILGWVSDGMSFREHSRWSGTISFRQAALGILSGMLPGNQLALLQSTLDVLGKLAEADDERIKLFDFSTKTVRGGNFQVGAARGESNAVSLTLSSFYYEAEDNRRNILFVSWGENELRFWAGAQTLTLQEGQYSPVRDVVRDRLGGMRDQLISRIPLME